MPELAQYTRRSSTKITPNTVEKLLQRLPLLKAEFTQIRAPQFPHLVDQLEFLADVVEDTAEGAYKEMPYHALAGAAFALIYAHRVIDIIPDFEKEIGHSDDAAVVRTVLTDYEPHFALYAKAHNIPWAKISSKV